MQVLYVGCTVCSALLLACVNIQEQVVRGVLTTSNAPLPDYALSLSSENGSCTPSIATIRTDGLGRFQHSHRVSSGRLAVVLQGLSLCDSRSGALLWSASIGPAPTAIFLSCDLAGAPVCTPHYSYSARGSAELPHSR